MPIWTNFTKPFTVNGNDDNVTIRLSETVTFASKDAIQKELNKISPNSTLTVDGSATKSVHPDVVEILHDFKTKASESGIEFKVVNL